MVYTTSLPTDKDCQKVTEEGETLYLCDGVLYRSTYYEDEKVYEIVSDPPAEAGQPQSVVGMGLTDPFTRGETVREFQNRLVGAGYDVGSVDGVFGSGTEAAVMWLQYDNGIESTGVVDPATANLLGYDVPGAAEPETQPDHGAPDTAAGGLEPSEPVTDIEAVETADEAETVAPDAGEPPTEPAQTDASSDDPAPEPQN